MKFYNPNNPGGLTISIPDSPFIPKEFQGAGYLRDDEKIIYIPQGDKLVLATFQEAKQVGIDPNNLPIGPTSGDLKSIGVSITSGGDLKSMFQSPQPLADITVPTDPMLAGGIEGARAMARKNAASLPTAQIPMNQGAQNQTGTAAYKVQKGDTLSKIAAQNGMTLPQLLELNPQYKKNPNLIRIGETINLSQGSQTATSPVSSTSSQASGGSSGSTQTSSNQTLQESNFDSLLKQFGLDPTQMTLQEKRQFGIFAEYLQNQISQNKTIETANRQVMSDALTAAQNDPDIINKYGDLAKAALSDFNTSMQNIDLEIQQLNRTQAYDLKKQREQQAEQFAEQGAAYSGFRQQAQQRLAAEQTGIVESTRSKIQQDLQKAGQSYESLYGTTPTTPSEQYVNPLTGTTESLIYKPLGLTGSVAMQKEADILAKQQQIYDLRTGQ